MKLLIPFHILAIAVTLALIYVWPDLNIWERIVLTPCLIIGDGGTILLTYWELKGET